MWNTNVSSTERSRKLLVQHACFTKCLRDLLKKHVISCSTEVYIFELEQVCPETGEWTEAKLDLEVVTSEGRYLLDVSVFHPFQNGRKGKQRHVKLSEREKRKYERYPMQKDGQRVTDATLVPIILNTFGAVGEKATEFLFAIAGSEAKRIIDEISFLAVFLSAEMILSSHSPSNLANLLPLAQAAERKEEVAGVEQPLDVCKEIDEETEKDECRFLRPDLRGEVQGNQVECLGCSSENKRVFRCGILWNWNRHVKAMHTKAAQPMPPEHVLLPEQAVPASAEHVEAAKWAKPASATHAEAAKRAKPASSKHSGTAARAKPARAEHAGLAARGKPASAEHAEPAARATPASAKHAEPTERAKPATARHDEPAARATPVSAGHAEPAVRAKPAAVRRAAQSAVQLLPQPVGGAHFGEVNVSCTIVDIGRANFSKAPVEKAMCLESVPKEQGSSGSRDKSTVPSKNPVSKESQAGKRKNLELIIPSPAKALKRDTPNVTFSSKDASMTK